MGAEGVGRDEERVGTVAGCQGGWGSRLEAREDQDRTEIYRAYFDSVQPEAEGRRTQGAQGQKVYATRLAPKENTRDQAGLEGRAEDRQDTASEDQDKQLPNATVRSYHVSGTPIAVSNKSDMEAATPVGPSQHSFG